MRLLLDSQALLRTMTAHSALSETVRNALIDANSVIFVSAVTPYELEWKKANGKLRFPHFADWSKQLKASGYEELPISIQHACCAALLDKHHRDPWDRVLVAQALIENLILVTSDEALAAYGVRTLW